MSRVQLTNGELREQLPWSETFEIETEGKTDFVFSLDIPRVINNKIHSIEELCKIKASFLIKDIIFGLRYENYFKCEPIVSQLITKNHGSFIELIRPEIAINVTEGKYIYSDNLFCKFKISNENSISITREEIEKGEHWAEIVIRNLPYGQNIKLFFTLSGYSRHRFY